MTAKDIFLLMTNSIRSIPLPFTFYFQMVPSRRCGRGHNHKSRDRRKLQPSVPGCRDCNFRRSPRSAYKNAWCVDSGFTSQREEIYAVVCVQLFIYLYIYLCYIVIGTMQRVVQGAQIPVFSDSFSDKNEEMISLKIHRFVGLQVNIFIFQLSYNTDSVRQGC